MSEMKSLRSKSVSIPTMAATLYYRGEDSQHTEAIVASFTNGKLPPGNAAGINFGYYKSTETDTATKKPSRKRILVAETDRLQYVGQNFGPSAPKMTELCKYMVGALDRSTGEMTFHDANYFQMRPLISDAEEAEDEVDAAKEQMSLSFMEKNDRLTSAFGSSKKRKAMDSRARNKVSTEGLEKAVGSAISKAQTNKDSIPVPVEHVDESSVIPPHDKDATTPAGVYSLNNIISDAEMESLKAAESLFTQATREQIIQWKEKELYPSYILHHLCLLPINEEARSHKARCLLYLNYLLKAKGFSSRDLQKRAIPFPDDTPNLVKTRILDRYTVTTGGTKFKPIRAVPARLKDKMICYILVLCLIIDDFHLDLSLIQKDLKILQKRLALLLGSLGCQIKSAPPSAENPGKAGQAGVLTVPLSLLKVNKPKTKQERR